MAFTSVREARFGGSLFFPVLLLLLGCSSESTGPEAELTPLPLTAHSLDVPFQGSAAQPFLTSSADGSIWMSWLAPDGEDHILAISKLEGDSWSEPVEITRRSDLFVNWADFPSVAALDDGTLLTHWLQMAGEGTYTYDVMYSLSKDEGENWTTPRVLHNDGVAAEHGFLSFTPVSADRVAAVWLDGRNMSGGGHGHGSGSMTVRYATIGPDGDVRDRSEMDGRVCECCQTGLARFGDDLIAVYRNRSDEEIRDIGYSVLRDGEWSEPGIVHPDGWEINGCPVNGPAIDAEGRYAATAWFTAADDMDRVNVAFSSDPLEGFDSPVRVDLGAPVGRVDLVMVEEGVALVTWIERTGALTAGVMARTVTRSGALGEPVELGETSSARASGFPRIAKAGDLVYAAWTEVGDESSALRMARVELGEGEVE